MVCVRVKMEVAGAHWNFLLLGASLLSLQADFSASVDWCGSVQSQAPVRCRLLGGQDDTCCACLWKCTCREAGF